MTRTMMAVVVCGSLGAFAQAQRLEGKVTEKIDAAGYSYLQVETAKGPQWAAVPVNELAKGTAVVIDVQAFMQNFESKTLKRTWPVIAFGTVSSPAPSAPTAAPAPAAGAPAMENPHAKGLPKTVSTPPLDGTVVERLDAGVYTYLRLKTASGETTWAAVPRAEVPNGMTVRIKNPQPMDGFTSPSLKRSFEHIVFGTLELPNPK